MDDLARGLVPSPAWASQPQTPDAQDSLEMGKQHLNALAA
jgi:hypothetical protein